MTAMSFSNLRVTIGIAILWAILVILHLGTGVLPASPYGRHPGDEVSSLQVSSAPIFIYRASSWISALIVQSLSFFSPLQYVHTTGQVTAVTFSVLPALEAGLGLICLSGLEFLFNRSNYEGTIATGKFIRTFVLLAVLIYVVRTGLGFASFHLGLMAMPSLSFPSAFREVSKGLWPGLIAFYLIIESNLTFDMNWSVQLLKGWSFCLSDLVFLVLCLPVGTTLWWNTTGIVLGTIGTLLTRRKQNAYLPSPTIRGHEPSSNEPKSRLAILGRASILTLLTLFYYWLSMPLAYRPGQLSTTLPGTDPIATFIIMTAPRKEDTLTETVKSYLDALPSDVSDESRFKFVVFTHFTDHPLFDSCRDRFAKDEKARKYIEFVRFPGNEINQKKHFDAAIRHAAEQLYPKSHYIGIIEDDFPLCSGEWNEVLRLIRDANKKLPDHCGIFIGTGGSGLIIRHNKIEASLISMHGVDPTDVGLQNCIRGKTCTGCQVVIPSRILMRHTGHNSSTLGNWYHAEKYQCGSRHPFIGNLDAVIL